MMLQKTSPVTMEFAMQPKLLSKFVVTPEGIVINGMALAKLSPWQAGYIQRAEELLRQVKKEEWESRAPHDSNHVPTLAKVNMLLALAQPVRLGKANFNPEQARDEDGRWTDEGGDTDSNADNIATNSDTGSGSNPSRLPQGQITTDTTTNNDNILGYPNGKNVINPNTNAPYPAPPNMNISDNVDQAKSASVRDMYNWFRQSGTMDYQRSTGVFNKGYRDVSNYNYGAVSASAGYSLNETLLAAGIYNVTRGSGISKDETIYGIKQDAVNNITQGWNDSAIWASQ